MSQKTIDEVIEAQADYIVKLQAKLNSSLARNAAEESSYWAQALSSACQSWETLISVRDRPRDLKLSQFLGGYMARLMRGAMDLLEVFFNGEKLTGVEHVEINAKPNEIARLEITHSEGHKRITVSQAWQKGDELSIHWMREQSIGSHPILLVDEVPRRSRLDLLTPAELAIYQAKQAVEEVGCHPLLTEAIVLLGQAQDKLADYVESARVQQ